MWGENSTSLSADRSLTIEIIKVVDQRSYDVIKHNLLECFVVDTEVTNVERTKETSSDDVSIPVSTFILDVIQ